VLVGILIAQAVLTAVLCWRNLDQMNPDGVSYCRTAEYLLAGSSDLAVNGYWGALLSWLSVPPMWLGVHAATAARGVQFCSALALTLAAHGVFQAIRIGPLAHAAVLTAVALNGALWAAFGISGDLLLAATVAALSWALCVRRTHILGVPIEIVAALFAALATFAKPIGFYFCLCMIAGTWGLRVLWSESSLLHAVKRTAITVAALVLFIAPWVTILSTHYGELTLSRSAGLNHSMLHPRVTHLWNLPSFTEIHRPDEGRITSWEDPTQRPGNHDLTWSPADTSELRNRQLALGALTLTRIRGMVGAIDFTHLALLCLLVIPGLSWVQPRERHGWRDAWLFLPLFISVCAYLPFMVHGRYLWPVWVSALGALAVGHTRVQTDLRSASRRVRVGLAALFLLPPIGTALYEVGTVLTQPPSRELAIARELADRLRAEGAVGPVVSWSPYTSKGLDPEGLYLAWELDQPWLSHIGVEILEPLPGDPPATRAEHLADEAAQLREAVRLGARVVLVKTRLDDPTASFPDDTLPSTLATEDAFVAPPYLEPAKWRALEPVDVSWGTPRSGSLQLHVRVDGG